MKRAGKTTIRLTCLALLVVLVTAAVVACGGGSTPPGASKALSSCEQGGYLFLRWQEGLELMLWHDLPGEGAASSAGFVAGRFYISTPQIQPSVEDTPPYDVVSALLLVAVSHVGRFYRPMRTPVLERLGLPGIALALLALAAILFAVVFRHPRRLLAVSLLGILAFVVLNLVSGRHALPQILIWPSPRTLSERYVQALAADDLEAALQLTHPSHECHQIMTQQFLDQRAQLTGRLGDGWSESDFRHSTAKRITNSYDDQMIQQLVHIQVETEAGRTAWLTLRMRYKPVLGARYICGMGIDPEG